MQQKAFNRKKAPSERVQSLNGISLTRASSLMREYDGSALPQSPQPLDCYDLFFSLQCVAVALAVEESYLPPLDAANSFLY